MKTEINSMLIKSDRFNIRVFIQKDIPDIESILKENNLYDENDTISDFFIIEENNSIIGVAQVRPYDSCFFLSYMAIRKVFQNNGIGTYLLKNLLSLIDKPVYLYTIIPEFYEKSGFRIVPQSEILPPRDESVCRICIPEKCRTMKWSPKGNLK